MPHIHKKAVCKYSDEQIFSVVNDVVCYPEFIEWCKKVDLLEQTETVTRACLHLQKGLIKQNFTTENTLVYPSSMQMRLLSGPFKQFAGQWRFTPQQGQEEKKQEQLGCQIEFDLNYEFSNHLLEMTVGPVFFHIADEMVQTFLQRADSLYG